MNAVLPRISIITPSFNQGEYIEQTILSVLSQGYPDLEYIVMDGGSTDCTINILKKYEERLTWISERDRGQSHAINKGLKIATGDVLAFLNSDDLYEPGALLKVGKFFADHSDAHWLTGKCRIINQNGMEIRKVITMYKNFWLSIRSFKVFLVLVYVSQPATFWRKVVVKEAGFIDESLNYSMDYDYFLRVGRAFKLWYLPEYLARFRVHPRSKAGTSPNAMIDADLEIAKRYTTSRVLIGLHTLHNALNKASYRLLLAPNQDSTAFTASPFAPPTDDP